jgi:tetratricopeptide (TPR) repeat protein/tRNA A-37 threonylcarbamoyl transferase component Bud32
MPDLIGKTLNGYQVIEQIGKGGMATVFRAYQPSLDRDVAIKVLPPYYAEQDETFLERFKREARAIAKLRHPNILMVMDFGQTEDVSFIVMEYVDAGTLKDQMDKPMALKEILNLVKQISSALDYAHEQGVVHRDVKPSNILLPKPDWALLTDFGLAKMVGGTFMTQSGLTVGTPAYMSPEQGGGHKIDHRTDIYSLGVMLYELVVGEVPYTAETPMAVVVKHIVDPLPMPRAKNPNVPEALQRVILKALAKNPDDRYQSAGDIAAAMEAVVAEDPDWSAAGITVVDAVREPIEDAPATKVLEEEALEDSEVPVDVEPATAVDEAVPVVEDEGALGAETVRPVDDPTFSEPAVVAEPVSSVQLKPKRKKWVYALGGVALLVVCGVIGAFAVNALQPQIEDLFGQSSDNNVVVDNDLGQPDFPDGEKPPDGDFGQPDFPDDQQPPSEGDGRALFDDGVHFVDQNNIIRAVESFQAALRAEPRLWGEFFPVVIGEFDSGDFESALQLFRAGAEAHPNPPLDDLAVFAWMLNDVEHSQDAYEIFFKIIEEVPSYVDAYYGLSSAAFYLQREYEALEFMVGQAQRVPDDPYVASAVASMYYWLGEYENSLITYESAMDMNPDDPMIYMWSVEVYIIVDEVDAAIEKIETARRLGPDRSDIAEMAGMYYRDLGMLQEALEAFEKAVDLDPGYIMPKVYLAQVLIDLDVELDRVTELLIEAERIGRDFYDLWALDSVAWTWIYFGDCERALEIFYYIESESWEIDVSEGLSYCGG